MVEAASADDNLEGLEKKVNEIKGQIAVPNGWKIKPIKREKWEGERWYDHLLVEAVVPVSGTCTRLRICPYYRSLDKGKKVRWEDAERARKESRICGFRFYDTYIKLDKPFKPEWTYVDGCPSWDSQEATTEHGHVRALLHDRKGVFFSKDRLRDAIIELNLCSNREGLIAQALFLNPNTACINEVSFAYHKLIDKQGRGELDKFLEFAGIKYQG